MRNAFRSLGLYTVVMIVQRAASILLLPVYTRYLSRSDYGVLELLELVPNVAGLLVGLHLSQSLYYFYHHAKDDAERRRYVATAFAAAVAIGLAVGAAGAASSAAISLLVFGSASYAGLVRVTFLGFATSLSVEVGFGYLRVTDRVRLFASATLCRLGANVTLNVLFLTVLRLDVATMPWSATITTGGLALFFATMIVREAAVFPSARLLARMARYSVPLAIAATGEFILHFGDRFFLKDHATLAQLGTYGLAYKLGMIVPYLMLPFYSYWNSQMVAIVKRPGGERIYARTATYVLLALSTVTLGLTVFARPLVAILADAEFAGASAFIPWVATAYLVRGLGNYCANSFLLDRRSGLVAATTWAGCLSCLIAYAFLIPRHGVWGAVASTLIGFGVMTAFTFALSQSVRPFRYEYGRWARIAAAALVAAAPTLVARPDGLVPQVALGLASMALFVLLLLASGFSTAEERKAVRGALGRSA